jgi:hypothetical protein
MGESEVLSEEEQSEEMDEELNSGIEITSMISKLQTLKHYVWT